MYSKQIHKYRILAITLVGIWTILSLAQIHKLEVSLDFANFLPKDNTEMAFFNTHSEIMGHRRGYLMIAIPSPYSVYDTSFLSAVADFTIQCRQLEMVEEATSLPLLIEPRKTFFGILSRSVINYKEPEKLARDSLLISKNPMLMGRYISKDHKTLIVYLNLSDQLNPQANQELIFRIDDMLEEAGFAEARFSGIPNFEARFSRLATKELQKFLGICMLLIIITLWLIYRNFLGVFLPLLLFLLTLINTGGLLAFLGHTLDMQSTLLPSILLIVSVSDAIHILAKFSPRKGSESEKAIFSGLNAVALNNFMTSFTTALGFCTLLLSPMVSIKSFGIAAAIGVMVAYLISISLIPAVLFCLKDIPSFRPRLFPIPLWTKVVVKIQWWLKEYPKRITISTMSLLVVSAVLIFQIPKNPTMTSALPENHSVRQDLQFFEAHLGGGRDYELAVLAKKGKLSQVHALKDIERLQQYLDTVHRISGLISPASYYQVLNKFNHGGNPAFYKLPDSQDEIKKLDRTSPALLDKSFQMILDTSRTRGAILGRMKDLGNNEIYSLNKQVDIWIKDSLNNTNLQFIPTGVPFLISLVNDLLVSTMFKGLGLAILFIGLLMSLLFRNWKLVFIFLIVNLVPMIMVGGMMGLLGIELRGGTSIAFTLSFVIVIDDTIHFLNNFNHYTKQHRSVSHALSDTLTHTGLAVLLTSIVLFLSFVILLTSDFGDVYVNGLLISVTVIFALLSDLILAPLLIKYFWH